MNPTPAIRNPENPFLRPGESVLYEGRPSGYPSPTTRLIIYALTFPVCAPYAWSVGESYAAQISGALPGLAVVGCALAFVAMEALYYAHWRSTYYLVTDGGRLLAIKHLVLAGKRWTRNLDGHETLFVHPRELELKTGFSAKRFYLRLAPYEAEHIADAMRRATGAPRGYPIFEAPAQPPGPFVELWRRHKRWLIALLLVSTATFSIVLPASSSSQDRHAQASLAASLGVTNAFATINGGLPDARQLQVTGGVFQRRFGPFNSNTYATYPSSNLPTGNLPAERLLVILTVDTGLFGDSEVRIETRGTESRRNPFHRALRQTMPANGVDDWTLQDPFP